MWRLFELLQLSFSSLIYGALISILCLILFFVLIKGWYRNSTYTPLSYLVGIILFLLLSFQCTLIIGGIKISSLSQEYTIQLETFVNRFYASSDEVPPQASTYLVDKLINKNPVLQHYIGEEEFSGYTAKQLPQVVVSTIKTFIWWYILRRLLWSFFFIGIGVFLVIRSMTVSRRHCRRSHINTRIPHSVRSPYSRGTQHVKRGF